MPWINKKHNNKQFQPLKVISVTYLSAFDAYKFCACLYEGGLKSSCDDISAPDDIFWPMRFKHCKNWWRSLVWLCWMEYQPCGLFNAKFCFYLCVCVIRWLASMAQETGVQYQVESYHRLKKKKKKKKKKKGIWCLFA